MTVQIDAVNNSAAWNNTANLYSTNFFDTNRYLIATVNPDKTAAWFAYNIGSTARSNIVYSGYFVGATKYTNIVSVDIMGMDGRLMSSTATEDGILTGQTIYTNYDTLGRVGAIVYLDGTAAGYQYDCCGISSETNRVGMVTGYTRDDLKRLYSKTENGVPGAIRVVFQLRSGGQVIVHLTARDKRAFHHAGFGYFRQCRAAGCIDLTPFQIPIGFLRR